MMMFSLLKLFLLAVTVDSAKKHIDARRRRSLDLPLDMAQKSVDDAYNDCAEKMSALVKSKYLSHDLKQQDFSSAWLKSASMNNCNAARDGLSVIHTIAICVYTRENPKMYDVFNKAVREDGHRYKSDKFKYTSLFFLLTDAIQHLKKSQTKCMTTYRRTNLTFKKNVINKIIRFGFFASSSLNKGQTTFGDVSCFEIYTCFGANLTKYSAFAHESEVLIPPYEKFKVREVIKKTKHRDLWCGVVYKLQSTGIKSTHDCRLIRKMPK